MIKRLLMLLSLSLMSLPAWAATYTFSSGSTFLNPFDPPPCSGSWSRSGSLFTCNGRVTLASGDVLRVSTSIFEGLGDIRVVASGGFALSSNATIGTAAKNISLESNWGTIDASGGTTVRGSITTASGAVSMTGSNNMLYGSVTGSNGNVSITGGTISGSVSTDGSVSLVNGSVAGDVYGRNGVTTNAVNVTGNLTSSGVVDLRGGTIGGLVESAGAITTNGTLVNGTLTSSNGTVNLTGGRITGLVRSNCCMITSNGTNLLAGAWAGSNGLNITGGTIQGPFFANGNVAQFSGVNMVFGSLSGASTATFSNSTLGSAELPVTVTTLYGPVNLNNTTAFGDFTAPDYATIFVNSPSTVTGTCLPHSTPREACRPPVVPRCLSDNFNRSSLGEDWAVTSRNGSFGVPRIINGRLRLTDNSGNVATGATIQRLVPAANNLVQIEFKYYAYNGSGADGVAVIFSDASLTPQPGGYGGSLGYAQLNGTSGFSGGWLGIALDEFGNFSNPTETRNGGPGARADSVAIRGSGSGTTGYRYLRGTAANLNPGVDVSGSSAGPGHTYRITLDSRTGGRTMVSVERNTGSGFVTLIAPFDAQAEAGQAALPTNFFVTLTGSTGGSNNIHELDDLSFCADRLESVGQQIDHFELSYDTASPLTCNPLPVTVKACVNATCSQLYTGPVTVELSPLNGWIGGMPRTFSGGQATFNLQVTTPGNVNLGVGKSTPPAKPLSQTVCSSANCRVTFVDSGFIFDVPDLIANQRSGAITLKARQTNPETRKCEPSFVNVTRQVSFWSEYLDPDPTEIRGAPRILLGFNEDSDSYIQSISIDASRPTEVPLAFDKEAEAKIWVRYPDAGKLQLHARHLSNEAYARGSDAFISRPYGLCVQVGSVCASADVSCPVFAGGIRAGDRFPVTIRAVAWELNGEERTAARLCQGNNTTPNFRHPNITLGSAVQAPAGGANGVMDPPNYTHVLGEQTTINTSISEVGVFTITATPQGAYIDGAHWVDGGSRDLVGRFIPAYLGVEGSAALEPACTAFSYQEQPISFSQNPNLTVTGFNRQGVETSNYDRGAFWRLNEPALTVPESIIGGRPGLNSRIRTVGNASVVVSDNAGDGARTFTWSGRRLQYAAAPLPSSEDAPVSIMARQPFTAAALTDQDGACYGGTTCLPYSFTFSGSDLRLGRLALGNAHGSELQGLSLPLRIESWRDGNFQVEAQDTCSAPLLGNPAPVAGTFTGNLSVGETTPSRSGPSAGVGQVLMSAPGAGNDGSVQVSLPSQPAWLNYAWDGATRQQARGLATFGIYQGSPPLIYRRELYR